MRCYSDTTRMTGTYSSTEKCCSTVDKNRQRIYVNTISSIGELDGATSGSAVCNTRTTVFLNHRKGITETATIDNIEIHVTNYYEIAALQLIFLLEHI